MEQQEQDKKEKQANTWAMFCHLSGMAIYIGIPLGNIIAPLIIWLIKKDELPSVDKNGKESLNFQISMTIYGIIAGLLWFVFIGIVLLPVILILDIVFIVIAAVKTNAGKEYRYPLTIRFIK